MSKISLDEEDYEIKRKGQNKSIGVNTDKGFIEYKKLIEEELKTLNN